MVEQGKMRSCHRDPQDTVDTITYNRQEIIVVLTPFWNSSTLCRCQLWVAVSLTSLTNIINDNKYASVRAIWLYFDVRRQITLFFTFKNREFKFRFPFLSRMTVNKFRFWISTKLSWRFNEYSNEHASRKHTLAFRFTQKLEKRAGRQADYLINSLINDVLTFNYCWVQFCSPDVSTG